MYDPKEILTDDGMVKLGGHLYNMRTAIVWLKNHADDLGIGHNDERQSALLYEMDEMLQIYKEGDGEEQEVWPEEQV